MSVNPRFKKYYEANKEMFLAKRKKYYKVNKKKLVKWQSEYTKKRMSIDPQFKIRHRLRTRIGNAIKAQRGTKSKKFIELLGCTAKEAYVYIESLFKDGMTWDNYGLWHIDHIRPCSSFDLTSEEQQKQCFHFSNLQPLWAEDNLRKGDLTSVPA